MGRIKTVAMKNLIYLFVFILMSGCDDSNDGELAELLSKFEIENLQYLKESDAHELLKKNCYVCHNPAAASHDEIIAPPMAAVKMRYSRWYPDEKEFTAAITSWVLDPRPEKALMKGAVDRFNVMPKQQFKPDDVKKIALYIYQNKLEEPEWFAAHERSMHGMGRGMRRAMDP